MSSKKQMQFIPLETNDQLEKIKEAKGVYAIFKHNTTCPISRGVKSQLELADQIEDIQSFYILDLLPHKDLSQSIAEAFDVEHESPQLLLIKDGVCTYNTDHYEISAEAIAAAMSKN